MPMTIVAKKKVMIFEKKLVCKYFKILKKNFFETLFQTNGLTGLILILNVNLMQPKMNIIKNKLEIDSQILVKAYQKVPNN